MTHIRLVKLVPLSVMAPCLLAGTALASTRGLETGGNSQGGLMIMLGLLALFSLFCFAYLCLDRVRGKLGKKVAVPEQAGVE
jgi:hypothetical protein